MGMGEGSLFDDLRKRKTMDVASFIGKTEAEAREMGRQSSLAIFVISRNGVPQAISEGYRMDRVQLVIENDRVVSAIIG